MPRVTRVTRVARVTRRSRLVLLPLAAFAALGIAACSSAAEPGWTFDPTTPAPPASAAPATEAPATSEPASDAPSAAPTNGGGEAGEVITLDALNIQWVERELSAPADAPFTIRFNNQDAGVPHNVEIKQNGASVFKGDIFNGVETRDYAVPALAAGTYDYICTVHPNMIGTLTVG